MHDLTDEQKAGFFQRSYASVDGLWFMKVEERYDFDTALEIDREVWKVLPKIQARTLKSMIDNGQGLDALRDALETKLSLERFEFTVEQADSGDAFTIFITECPWHNLMVKSGRKHLSKKIGDAICKTEFPIWANEFGGRIGFRMESQLCGDQDRCILRFFEERQE